MTERGLPIVDGAPACPFVAFEDDRDGRALAPDHRHRCFAEPRPAPRALAHQEAYCLSSAFPVCPTFQDWARREAAAARIPPAADRDARPAPPVSQPLPQRELEPRHTLDTDAPPLVPAPARRSQPRDWAAPPPWAADAADMDEPPDDGPLFDDRDLDPLDDPRGYDYDPQAPYAPAPVEAVAPAFLADRDAARDPGRGLAGSAADRLAGPDPDAVQPARRTAQPTDDLDAAWPGAGVAAVAAAGSTAPRPQPPTSPQRHGGPDSRRDDRSATGRRQPVPPPTSRSRESADRPPAATPGRPAQPQESQELFGPAWEKPRHYEAYPSLKTRIGMPNLGALPRIGVAAIALVLAAVILFFVGPMLLGIGGKSPDAAGGTPAPVATEQTTDSPAPTIRPEPTPQVYIVAKNDTMSKIARKFGVTLEALLAANPQIKKPDRIAIGDPVNIPVPVSDGGSDGTVQGSAVP